MIKENNLIIKNLSNEFDLDFAKAVSFTEAAYRELLINYKDAELKVVQENGTSDDLAYLKEAASGNFLDRLKTGLSKIGQSFKKFSTNLYNKIFKKRQMDDETLKKLAILAKQNPQVGSLKIEIKDYNTIFKSYDKARSGLKMVLAKTSSVATSKGEVEKVMVTLKEDRAKAKTQLITINQALDLLLTGPLSTKNIISYISRSNKDVENVTKVQVATIDKLKNTKSNDITLIDNDESKIQVCNYILEKYTLLEKQFLSDCVVISTSIVGAIKNGIKGKAAVDVSEATYSERFMEIYDAINTVYEAEGIDNPDNPSTHNNDLSGDDGYDTTPIENNKNESGPDIDDDPWTDVIDDDPDETIDDIDIECGDNCGGYGCATEGYSDKFAEIIAEIDKAGLANKASNESILSSLYGNLGSGKEIEDKGALKTESTFDYLLESINDLY